MREQYSVQRKKSTSSLFDEICAKLLLFTHACLYNEIIELIFCTLYGRGN